MQRRTEALAGVVALGVLLALAAALGQRRNADPQADRRASTFLAGPFGARGLAEGLEGLGIVVKRVRRGIGRWPGDDGAGTAALVLLDPSEPLGHGDVRRVLAWSEEPDGGDLLLAGPGAEPVMRCFGYSLDWRGRDSVAVVASGSSEAGEWPRVAALLARHSETTVTDTSRLSDAVAVECAVPAVIAAETLLVGPGRRASVLRLTREDSRRQVTLVSDAGLLRNRALRDTDAGVWALGLFAGRDARVIFAEAEHGFAEGGSLAGATLAWSRRSPLGWAGWQLAVVGLVSVLAGAVRFGPVRHVIVRRRRSPLEHVRALATALSAARGHDVAIAAMIRGLRRRLSPARQAQGELGPWLKQLGSNLRTPRAREAVQTLERLTRPGQSAPGVLMAANAVEDVWEELSP